MMERKRAFSMDEDVFGAKSWSASQRRALTAVLVKGQSVLITGAGGVGKSECVKHIVQVLRGRGLKVAVTAHTGIAAITVKGQTLWSFMHFTPQLVARGKEEIAAAVLAKPHWCAAFASYRTLVIDEISMVDPREFEVMDHVLQLARRDYRPFGGLQLVLVGDFFQLPSPARRGLAVHRYVFQSDAFFAAIDDAHDLQEMWRQRDPDFVALLHRARRGQQTAADVALLHARIGVRLPCEDAGIAPTRLYSKNRDVDAINEAELEKLEGAERSFGVRFGAYKRGFSASRESAAPIIAVKSLLKGLGLLEGDARVEKLSDIVVAPARLKVGAQVMLTTNLDTASGLVNGARGVLLDWGKIAAERKALGMPQRRSDAEAAFAIKGDESVLYPDERLPVVRFACGRTIEVPYVRATLDSGGAEAYAWRIGVKLAWATTIHKSQSMTLDAAEVDISDCFDAGMAYVALSRVTALENLRIAAPFAASAFKIDPDVSAYYDTAFVLQKALWAARQAPQAAGAGGASASKEASEALAAPTPQAAPASTRSSFGEPRRRSAKAARGGGGAAAQRGAPLASVEILDEAEALALLLA